jgi:hypothetical protein
MLCFPVRYEMTRGQPSRHHPFFFTLHSIPGPAPAHGRSSDHRDDVAFRVDHSPKQSGPDSQRAFSANGRFRVRPD